jgi:hypothetical protein
MMTLASILQEAKRDPSLQNTTVLNDDQFCPIRGPTNPIFRQRLDAAIAGSGDLDKVQQVNAEEGLEVIQPVQAGIHGGCWDLRNLTHGGEAFPAGDCQYRSIVEALEAAIEWWQAETRCRGVVVRVYDINQADTPP